MTVDTTISIESLVDKILIGNGIRVGNIKCLTDKRAIGYFNCTKNKIGIKSGVLLTTGWATNAIGPNTSPGQTGVLYNYSKKWKGDKDLNKLTAGLKPYDLTVVEFDFVPMHNKVTFEYSFGSEEYKEYVGSRFNDVFGFFITGHAMRRKNVALLPNDKKFVAINNINQKKNPQLFVDNDPFINKSLFKTVKFKPKISFWQKVAGLLFSKRTTQADSVLFYTNKLKTQFLDETVFKTFEYDGFTKKLKVEFYVTPYEKYHIKMAIGDVGDQAFDSGVFLEEKSFVSSKDTSMPKFIDYIDKDQYFNYDSIFGLKKFIVLEEEDHFEVMEKTIIHFGIDSYEIPDSCKSKLNELSEMLRKAPTFKLNLTGYADNTGNRKKNKILSEKRAESVMFYLTQHGVERIRLNYIGHSEDNPIGDNKTTTGKAQNRRVEIELAE